MPDAVAAGPEESARRKRYRMLDDVAVALAPSLLRRPLFVVLALVLGPAIASFMRLPGVLLAVLAGIGAAGLIRGGAWTTRRAATWFAVVGGLSLVVGFGAASLGPGGLFPLLPVPLAVGVASVSLAWTLGSPQPCWRVPVTVLGAAAVLLLAFDLDPQELVEGQRPGAEEPFADLLLGIGLLAGARLGIASRWWIAALAGALVLGTLGTSMRPEDFVDGEHWAGMLAVGAATAGLAFAARIAVAARGGGEAAADRAAARLVVRWQTRPWRSSLGAIGLEVLAMLGALGFFAATFQLFGSSLPLRELRTFLILVVLGGGIGMWVGLPAAMLHFTHGVQWMLERTAAVVVPMLVLAGAGLALMLPFGANPEAVAWMVLGTSGPALWAWLTGRLLLRGALPFVAWLAVLGLIVLVNVLAPGRLDEAIAAVSALSVITLCVHQFTHGRRVWMDAKLVVLCGVSLVFIHDRSPGWSAWVAWAGLCTGVACALAFLVAAARRARSMTAVPLHHPIYTDFGGPAVSPGGSARSGSTSRE